MINFDIGYDAGWRSIHLWISGDSNRANRCSSLDGWVPGLRHLAQDICFGAVPAGHRRCPRRPAGVRATAVEGTVARDGVTACRNRDRVGAAGADGNVTVDAGADQGHGPRPRARQSRRRTPNAVEVPGQGAIGGIVSRARRGDPGQARNTQGQADQGDFHFP